jgi:very-short-patch-repair endonuclease
MNSPDCKRCLAAEAAARRAARPPKPKRLTDRNRETKVCNRCLIEKPVSEFYWNQRKWTQPCKPCLSKREKERRLADPEAIRQKVREAHKRSPEDVKERRKARCHAYYAANREQLVQRSRAYWAENRETLIEKQRSQYVHKTPEEISAAHRAGWASMDPAVRTEMLARRGKSRQATWLTLPKEERQRIARENLHSPEALAKLSRALTGRERSPEHAANLARAARAAQDTPEYRQRRSEIAKQWWSGKTREERLAYTEPARRLSTGKSDTSIERAVAAVLDSLNVAYDAQVEIFGYSVDFLVRDLGLIIECDGRYWHSMPGRAEHDRLRDATLTGAGFCVVRLDEQDIQADAAASVRYALALSGHIVHDG